MIDDDDDDDNVVVEVVGAGDNGLMVLTTTQNHWGRAFLKYRITFAGCLAMTVLGAAP